MTDATMPSDTELAALAQAGDRHAFDLLVTRHKNSLYRFVRRYIGSDADAYDVVQDSFISAWMALRRYDKRKPFWVWLRAIALNKRRDFGRRQTVRRRFLRLFGMREIEVPSASAEEVAAAIEHDKREEVRLQRLDRAIATLPAFYKEPLLLTTVGGLSQQDTAQQLNTTTKAIEMRLRRARKQLGEALADLKKDS